MPRCCGPAASKDILSIGHLSVDLRDIDNIIVIGAGKASAHMAAAVENLLGKNLQRSGFSQIRAHGAAELH
jgi:glycerate-2-kinase